MGIDVLYAIAFSIAFLWAMFMIWVATRDNPLSVFFKAIISAVSGKYRRYVFFLILLLIIDLTETYFDPRITEIIGRDYTDLFAALEGRILSAIQLEDLLLSSYFSFFYVIVHSCLFVVTPIVLMYEGKKREIFCLTVGLYLCYIVALPFYLLFPVLSPWSVDYIHVRQLMSDVHPLLKKLLNPAQSPDNCFPSLHVAHCTFMAMISMFSGLRAFGILMIFSATSIVLSTFYLGVHWLLDVAAGIFLSTMVFLVVRYISEGMEEEESLKEMSLKEVIRGIREALPRFDLRSFREQEGKIRYGFQVGRG